MKLRSLVFGAAIILIANAFALVHSALNRIGTPNAVITLSEREITPGYSPPSEDDSSVTLYLNSADIDAFRHLRWLDRQKLEQLGFKCSVKAGGSEASKFYLRQRPRPAFVALEYNGQAWQALHEDFERNRTARQARNETVFPAYDSDSSHLVAIDADLNDSSLRKRHPDENSVLIVSALISVYANDKSPMGFSGDIRLLYSSIHVPRPFSDRFRTLKQPLASFGSHSDGISIKQPMPPYSVQLHFGTFHEPWVTAVEIP